jgi:1-phosphatidylinositol phosphodiesterase
MLRGYRSAGWSWPLGCGWRDSFYYKMKKIVTTLIFLAVTSWLMLVAGCSKISTAQDGQCDLGGTRRVVFYFHNLLSYNIYVEVSQVCNHDWQSQNRPERMERAYASGESYGHQMDMNTWDRTFPATFTFYRWDPVSGAKVGAALDQWRMTDLHSIDYPKIESMNSGYRGKIQVITSSYDNVIHAVLAPASLALRDWVAEMPDTAYLSELSIPGTHDSGTYNYTGVLSPWVICQTKSFTETLNEGCRALDIRLAPDTSTELKIHHGSYNTGLKFAASFLTDCKNFLASHTREVIVARLQKDDGSAATVKDTLDTILNENEWKNLVYTIASTAEFPQLGGVRGKIVLIYDGGIYDSRAKGYWLNYPSDTSEDLTWEASTPGHKWFVHDNYEATNYSMKISHLDSYLNDLLNLSYSEKAVMPFMFLSAAEHNIWTALNTPYSYSVHVNPYACSRIAGIDPAKRLGIVNMDFFSSGLGYLLVARNYYKHNLIPLP